MNLLFDTNVLIYLARDYQNRILSTINPENKQIFLSVATLGELKSISIQNNWGSKKWEVLDAIIDECILVEINDNLIETYSEIDSYSQRKNPKFGTYIFDTPRNMGKNDLWIAATGSFLNLKLITTDSDFDHLNKVFLHVEKWIPEQFKKIING